MGTFNYKPSAKQGIGFVAAEKDSGFVPTIDNDHARVHNDQMFAACQRDVALADDGVLLFEFIVPEGVELHLKSLTAWTTEEHWQYELIALPTLTTGATPLVAQPCKWPSARVNPIVIKSNPTSISGGTEMNCFFFGGGSGVGQSVTSGGAEQRVERELGEGTYLVRLTNLTGGVAKISANVYFYFTDED